MAKCRNTLTVLTTIPARPPYHASCADGHTHEFDSFVNALKRTEFLCNEEISD